MEVPYDEIKETLDRSWSSRLVDIVVADDEDEAERAIDALGDLGDPAVFDRLFALAEDSSLDAEVRLRILRVITDCGVWPERQAMRAWWNSDDPLLRADALEAALPTDAGVLREVGADPFHPFYVNAIHAMSFDFDEPEWQIYKTAALSHFDPVVQEAAADALIWDEPVIAEAGLIALANGPNTEAATTAIGTLRFFESRRTLLALDELRHHADSVRSNAAENAFLLMCETFDTLLSGHFETSAALEQFQEWMRPVIGLVVAHGVSTHSLPYEYSAAPEGLPLPPLQELMKVFGDISGKWAQQFVLLRNADWAHVPQADRTSLRSLFIDHPDPMVRRDVTHVFAAWHDTDALLALSNDDRQMVRRRALDCLSEVPVSDEVASFLWTRIADKSIGGWDATAALGAWVHHAGEDIHETLIDLVLKDTREGVRLHASWALDDAHASRIEPLLSESPGVTWEVHSSTIAKFAGAGMSERFAHLRDVDDLGVAWALARLNT